MGVAKTDDCSPTMILADNGFSEGVSAMRTHTRISELAEQIRVNRRTIMRWLVRIGYAPPSTFVTYVSMRFRSDGERSINATPMHNLSIM